MTFGLYIEEHRGKQRKTLDQVGSAMEPKVGHPRLSKIENGRCKPTAREVSELVRVLELDPAEALRLAAEVVVTAASDDAHEAA